MSRKFKCALLAFSAVFAVGLCVSLPLAVYLILFEIDPTTHFYYDNAWLAPIFNGFLCVLTVLLVLPIFFKKAGAADGYTAQKRPAVAVFSMLTGLALCLQSAHQILTSLSVKTMSIGTLLTGLAGLLAAIFFFALAVTLFQAKPADLRFVALLPVIWGVVNLISTFMSLTQVANISQYLFQVLQMVFAILFLYYNARITGRVSNGREINGVFAFGLPCALFGLLASVPNITAHLINRHRGSLPQTGDILFFVMTIYILALLVSLLTAKPEVFAAPAEAPEAEEPAAREDTTPTAPSEPSEPIEPENKDDKPNTDF